MPTRLNECASLNRVRLNRIPYCCAKQRIYVTGLSMGGFGTWSLAVHQPRRFAALVPICGGGEPIVTMLFPQIPVWVFHGAKDFVVPIERSEKMVEALKKFGGHVNLTGCAGT